MSRRRAPEPQWATGGWAVARRRGHAARHGYEVLYRGQSVGWVSRRTDGWRWHLSWSPGATGRAPRWGLDRVSRRPYASWQTAVSALARTDVGRLHAGSARPSAREWQPHYTVRGRPWEPTPEPADEYGDQAEQAL